MELKFGGSWDLNTTYNWDSNLSCNVGNPYSIRPDGATLRYVGLQAQQSNPNAPQEAKSRRLRQTQGFQKPFTTE